MTGAMLEVQKARMRLARLRISTLKHQYWK